MEKIIEAVNISKKYSSGDITVQALHSTNVEVEKGEIVVILGKSGSGKSTLLNMLGGLDIPDTGDVYVDGQTLYNVSDKKRTKLRNQKIGFVFQSFNLISELNVRENIRLPLDLANQKVDIEYEREIVKMLDLESRLTFFPKQLSGGQQQRVAIARAMIKRPEIILADEPTGNIDSSAGEELLNFIEESNRDYNQTFVIVTHDLAIAKRAHRIIKITDGVIDLL